ncbi:MAG: hypothetical protein ACU0CO_10810 [Shimia sp.]
MTGNEEQRVVWPWPERDDETVEVVLTAEAIAAIRAGLVWWDATENGAPGLYDAGDEEEDEERSDPGDAARDVFFQRGEVSEWAGPIRNPFPDLDPATRAECLEDLPDPTLRARLETEREIDFTPDADLLSLWNEANLGPEGIDPKRPFGMSDVQRHMRTLLDPDETDPDFEARATRAEAGMMPMLMRFLQTAEVAPGCYLRGADHLWHKPEETDEAGGTAGGDALTYSEWVDRTYSAYLHQSRAYVATMEAVAHLMSEGRLQGTMAEVHAAMRLGDAYDSLEDTYSEVTTETALRHAHDRFDAPDKRLILALLLRILNAQGRHEEVRALCRDAPQMPTEQPLLKDGIGWPLLLDLERQLAEFGIDVAESGLYLDQTQNWDDLEGLGWSDVHNRAFGDEPDWDEVHPLHGRTLKAWALQIMVLRGPL